MKFRGLFTLLTILALPVFLAAANLPSLPPMTEKLEWKGRIVVEFKGDQQPVTDASGIVRLGNADLDALARQYNVHAITKLFPATQKPLDPDKQDLTRIYVVEFPPDIDLHAVAAAYGDNSEVVYTEPYPIRKMDYVPSDPMLSQQWAMSAIHVTQAYDYNRGEKPVIIGIVDSGTDTTHPDLRSNLWINPNEDLNHNGIIEPIEWNGIDNGGNGYIDDFYGWSFLTNDNNIQPPPQSPSHPYDESHGTHVAGDASACTDNATGIVSPGYNAKIMTCRAGQNGYIYYGYQGITYCADNRADVISLSWGGYGSYWTEQLTINYAWDHGSIIVAAAGNNDSIAVYYPAGYDHVISVAATGAGDTKAYFSNYGPWIDVCAPGDNILSTVIGGYGNMSGTSMACPITAGLIAQVLSVDTSQTQDQVINTLYNTCTNIDNVNPGLQGYLGHGRIDAGAALASMFPNLSLLQVSYDDSQGGNGDGRPDPGETVNMILTLRNGSTTYNAVGVTATITCEDPYITMIQGGSTFGNIQPGTNQTNTSNPVRFSVNQSAPVHETTFHLTIGSQSLIYPVQIQFGQMIGRPDILVVSDDSTCTYESWYDQDLDSLGKIHDDWDVNGRGEIPLNELTQYPNVIWHTSNYDAPLTQAEQDNIQYFLSHGGRLFLTGEDIDEQLAGTTFYANVLHCTSLSAPGYFMLTGVPGNMYFEGTSLVLAGGGGAGNNQSPNAITPAGDGAYMAYTYNSTGQGAGISWDDGTNALVYFAFNFEAASGVNNSTYRRVVLNSILNWFDTFGYSAIRPLPPGTSAPSAYDLKQNFPNPFNPATQISFDLPKSGSVKLSVWNVAGRQVAVLVNGNLTAGYHQVAFDGGNLASGVYLYRLEAGGMTITRKMLLMK